MELARIFLVLVAKSEITSPLHTKQKLVVKPIYKALTLVNFGG